jgi:hypothetical protein
LRFAGSGDFLLGALGLAVVGLGLPTLAVAMSGTAGPQIGFTLSVPAIRILIVAYGAYLVAFAVFGLRGGRSSAPRCAAHVRISCARPSSAWAW